MPKCRIHSIEYSALSDCPACKQHRQVQRDAQRRDRDREENEQRRHEEQLNQVERSRDRAAREARKLHEEQVAEATRRLESAAREGRRLQEEQEARDEEILHRQQHPGDYQCPECLYTTLLRDARRCPTCHAVVLSEYWQAVRIREEAALARRQVEAELAAEQRRAAEAMAAERKRAAEVEEAAAWERAAPDRARKAAAAERSAWLRKFVRLYFAYLLPVMVSISVSIVFSVLNSPPFSFQLSDFVPALLPGVNWALMLRSLIQALLYLGGSSYGSAMLASALLWTIVGFLIRQAAKAAEGESTRA